jgi:TM2 domain-containing membrane protein YozV
LNDDAPIGALEAEPLHKSAGLAFGLSFLIPGLGQFYCGKTARGGATLGFWVLGLGLCFSGVPAAIYGQALVVMLVLWIFSFLDAYFTAIEINRKQDDLLEGQNPRVAVTLNLLTAGFGYFYLGERTKGILLFVAMQVARLALPSTGRLGLWISLAVVVVQLAVAFDAYGIARRQVKKSLASIGPTQPGANAVPASQLPEQVPVMLACFLSLGFVVLVVAGLVWGPHWGNRLAAASRRARGSLRAQGGVGREAVDLPTAVQDVQRVQRKPVRTKADIPNLEQDARVLTTVLSDSNIDSTDATVAHYYRAVALAMINMVHEHEGEAMDASGARMARADLDAIIGAGRVTTYVPEVSISSAEYWAGLVARQQRDDPAAFAYWEKCAWNTHAGCMHDVAGAKVSGEGGEKIDIPEALDLHTTVFNSGIKYRCAGAQSAMSIAYINYFTGVRRPGDDEMEWTRRADALSDQLEAAEHNRNVCHRAEHEVDEFLFQLSRGHRDDNILQDAMTRLDDDSNNVKPVIQFLSGAIDEAEFDAAVQSEKSQGERCWAYFSAMWYAELHKEDAMAKRFHRRMVDIGKFHCGQHLVYAEKFKF